MGMIGNQQTMSVATPTSVSDTPNTSTGAFDVPSGTTAQRPSSPSVGYLRYNTDLDCLENYTATGWLKVSIPIPALSSISGTVYSGATSTLTLTGTQFGTAAGTVRFVSGATTKDVTATPSSATSVSVAVPSEIYGLSASAVVIIKFINGDGGQSNTVDKTVVSLPTGGVITTSGGYRYHEFKSTANLVTYSSLTAEVLVVAGGGGGGFDVGGGGGAGGLVFSSSVALTAGTYTATVGGGGTGSSTTNVNGTNGNNSSFTGLTTAIGGGGGGSYSAPTQGSSGGSGGGGGSTTGSGYVSGGNGTTGQGNGGGAGARGFSDGNYGVGGGGGGAGAAGNNGDNAGGKGGNGLYYAQFTAWGSPAGWFAGGGGGASDSNGTTGAGGSGGGGNGGGNPGVAYTGGGGGGPGLATSGNNGGSGIVLVRYQL